MKKIYSATCGRYRKFTNPKILYIFEEILVLPIIFSVRMKMKKYLKKNQLRY